MEDQPLIVKVIYQRGLHSSELLFEKTFNIGVDKEGRYWSYITQSYATEFDKMLLAQSVFGMTDVKELTIDDVVAQMPAHNIHYPGKPE